MQKSNFTVIEDEREIKQAQLTFAKNMQKEATKDGEIIAGHQGGQGEKLHAYWFKDNKFWWAYKPVPNEKVPRWWNSFSARKTLLHRNGEPHWNKTNGITCEINTPLSGNTWQTAGVFVKDQDNKIYIAHTGKIGGGRAGVGKTTFVNNFPGKNKWHQVSGSRGKKNVVIVSNINDPKLIDNVGFFVKAVEKLKPGKNSNDEFEFVKKDFTSLTKRKKDAQYRHKRFKELLVTLNSNLSSSFIDSRSYVSHPFNQGRGEFNPYTWLGIYFGEKKFDAVQFQVALSKDDPRGGTLTTGIWIDGLAKTTRQNFAGLSGEQKDDCIAILKKLPPKYYVSLRTAQAKQPYKREKMFASSMDDKMMETIMEGMSKRKTELFVGRSFSVADALKMKTTIVDEFSDTFEKLLPLQKFLTVQNSSNGDMNIDKKVEGWLKRGARLAGQSIEDYTRYLGKDEYEARYKTYSKLKVVLEN